MQHYPKNYYALHEHDGIRINLSKASLGKCFYDILGCGAELASSYAFNPKYHRSAVLVMIRASEDEIKQLRELGYIFVDPPTINLN